MIKLHDMTIRLGAGVKTLQEVVIVLAPIIHAFSCRIYGLYKYKKGLKEDESLQNGNPSNASSD